MLGSGFASEMSKIAEHDSKLEALAILSAGNVASDAARRVAGPRFIRSIDFKDTAEKKRLTQALREHAHREGIHVLSGAQSRTPIGHILDTLMETGQVPDKNIRAMHGKTPGVFYEPFGNAAFMRAPDRQSAITALAMLRKEHFPGGEADKLTASDVRKGIIFGHSQLVDHAPALLSHELGHSTQSSLLQRLSGYGAVGNTMLPISLLAIGDPGRTALPIGAASALAAIPRLFAERQASNRGIELMRSQGAKPAEVEKAKHSLNNALHTYYATMLPIPAALIAYGLARKFIK